jgi:hypothetical protein
VGGAKPDGSHWKLTQDKAFVHRGWNLRVLH